MYNSYLSSDPRGGSLQGIGGSSYYSGAGVGRWLRGSEDIGEGVETGRGRRVQRVQL